MARAYLSCGSNLGDRRAYLRLAAAQLADHAQITLSGVSSLYQTAAWGPVAQPDFLNCALAVDTTLAPLALLDVCQQIELMAGRRRLTHWGSRTLDIDILLYGALRLTEPRLTLPHPYLAQRRFVLVPLAELAAGQPLPLLGDVTALLAACADENAVVRDQAAGEWFEPRNFEEKES